MQQMDLYNLSTFDARRSVKIAKPNQPAETYNLLTF